MFIQIRQEKPEDFRTVATLIEAAFRSMEYSDHREHLLVERLRRSAAFIPELSIVAELEGTVVGHILFTKIRINNEAQSFESLALAPVSVHPDHQGQGIGGELIEEGHRIARKMGFQSVVLVGHEHYYPRFGYERCSQYGIALPFEAPEANCMVVALSEGGLDGVSGMVEYDKTFFE